MSMMFIGMCVGAFAGGFIGALVIRRRAAREAAATWRFHLSTVAATNRYIYRTEHHINALRAEVTRRGGDADAIRNQSCADTAPRIREMLGEAIASELALNPEKD